MIAAPRPTCSSLSPRSLWSSQIGSQRPVCSICFLKVAASDYWANNEQFYLQRCFVGFFADLSATLVFAVRISRQCLVTVTLLCPGRLSARRNYSRSLLLQRFVEQEMKLSLSRRNYFRPLVPAISRLLSLMHEQSVSQLVNQLQCMHSIRRLATSFAVGALCGAGR